jgi:hypothetical protein
MHVQFDISNIISGSLSVYSLYLVLGWTKIVREGERFGAYEHFVPEAHGTDFGALCGARVQGKRAPGPRKQQEELRGAYSAYSAEEMLKISLVLHCPPPPPPLIGTFNVSIAELPIYPGGPDGVSPQAAREL